MTILYPTLDGVLTPILPSARFDVAFRASISKALANLRAHEELVFGEGRFYRNRPVGFPWRSRSHGDKRAQIYKNGVGGIEFIPAARRNNNADIAKSTMNTPFRPMTGTAAPEATLVFQKTSAMNGTRI